MANGDGYGYGLELETLNVELGTLNHLVNYQLIIHIHQILPFAPDGKDGCIGRIQCALPPAGEIAQGITEALGLHTLSAKGEDGYGGAYRAFE